VNLLGQARRELYDAFPHDVEIIRGSDRNCLEGCDSNTLATLQMFYLDMEGKGGFSIVMGKGFEKERIDGIDGRVYIAGPCAYDEVYESLAGRLGRKNVFFTRECNDLAGNLEALTKLMKVNTLKIVPINPLRSLSLLANAKLHRTTARIPPLF
jgi:hypothetical protein